MKKVILFTFAILFFSCEKKQTGFDGVHYELNKPATNNDINAKFKIIEIDGCEYIVYRFSANNGLMTHKGNCKYCLNR